MVQVMLKDVLMKFMWKLYDNFYFYYTSQGSSAQNMVLHICYFTWTTNVIAFLLLETTATATVSSTRWSGVDTFSSYIL